MKSLVPALLGALVLLPMAALGRRRQAGRSSERPASPGLRHGGRRASSIRTSGTVTINCVGVTAEFGGQLAGILTYVLQRRLDPEIVIAKLDEINGAPAGNTPRNLTTDQGQALVQSLMAAANRRRSRSPPTPKKPEPGELRAGDRDAARHGGLANSRQPDQPHGAARA